MGAGDSQQHHIQDAGEKYCVYQLQKIAVIAGKSITGKYEDEKKAFEDYCAKRQIVNKFNKSPYKEIYDTHLLKFFSGIEAKHPTSKFQFIDVEKEFRNQNKKGDFVIKFTDGASAVSFSLKNYKNGWNRPQICSGTWSSFISNLLLDKVGVGKYQMSNGSQYSSSDISSRNEDLRQRELYTPEVKDFFDWYDHEVMPYIRATYVRGESAEYWENIERQWKKDCQEISLKAIDRVIAVFKSVDPERIYGTIKRMSGMEWGEELLLLGPKGYMCSYTNMKYRRLLQRINSPNCAMEYHKRKKSLLCCFKDDEGGILEIEVPFTLQANGAWHRPKGLYEGFSYHSKEEKNLKWGQRRPKKSKELATSINTYVNLKKSLSL